MGLQGVDSTNKRTKNNLEARREVFGRPEKLLEFNRWLNLVFFYRRYTYTRVQLTKQLNL